MYEVKGREAEEKQSDARVFYGVWLTGKGKHKGQSFWACDWSRVRGKQIPLITFATDPADLGLLLNTWKDSKQVKSAVIRQVLVPGPIEVAE